VFSRILHCEVTPSLPYLTPWTPVTKYSPTQVVGSYGVCVSTRIIWNSLVWRFTLPPPFVYPFDHLFMPI
jgi:hypothetical protein